MIWQQVIYRIIDWSLFLTRHCVYAGILANRTAEYNNAYYIPQICYFENTSNSETDIYVYIL